MNKFLRFLYNLKIPILKRLIPSLIKRNIFLNKIQILDLDFIKIRVDLSQIIDREIYLSGSYEKEQILFLQTLLKKNNVSNFFDVGSNIGYYSLYFKDIPNIFAFEPNSKNFESLKFNKKLNNQKNIRLFDFGLSDSNSECEIWYTDKNKMGGSSIFHEKDPELKKYSDKKIIKEKIKVKKLDDVVDIKNSNNLIKIDVERHELKVLKGMSQLIKNNNCILQIEIGKSNRKEVFDYLNSLDFVFIKSIGHDHYFVKSKNS